MRRRGAPGRPRGFWTRLARDERGAVLIYVTAILGVVLAFGALVLDGGRLASLQSELQAFADHTALAAAGELDGRAGAIARATAAAGLITADRQTFGTGAAALDPVAGLSLRFLSSLPANDDAPVAATAVTTSDTLARYAEVTVIPHHINLWLIPGAAGLFGFATGATGTTGATAVAGFTQHVCDAAPLMLCSPSGAGYTPVPGRMIQLKSQNSWGPGAFGLLDGNFDPSGPCGEANQGADFFRCVVAAVSNVTRCATRRGVDIRPGQVTGAAAAGFNTRFDIYATNLHSKRNDPLFAPAPNVVRGFGPDGGGQCIGGNIAAYADSDPLPRDSCFATNSCAHGNTLGNGQWDKAGYWALNHGGAPPAATTRYELYLAEIAGAPSANRILPAPHAETGRPRCSNATPAGPDRRVLVAAVVDCDSLPPGNASNVPVLAFVRMFLTEAAGLDPDGDNSSLWVEEIGGLPPAGTGGTASGIAHDVVQLHR